MRAIVCHLAFRSFTRRLIVGPKASKRSLLSTSTSMRAGRQWAHWSSRRGQGESKKGGLSLSMLPRALPDHEGRCDGNGQRDCEDHSELIMRLPPLAGQCSPPVAGTRTVVWETVRTT